MKLALAVAVLVVTVVVAVVMFRPDDPQQLDFSVFTGVELGLTPEDQLVHSFSTGVWRGVTDGSLLTITERHLFGDEGSESTTITLSLAGDTAAVVRARWESSDAYAGDKEADYRTGSLEFQSMDIDGIVAGVLTPTGEQPIRFWVDMRPGAIVETAFPGDVFQLPPGGLAILRDFTVVRFTEIREDSRCPEDATCVWEGAVRVAVTVYEDGVPSPALLEGFDSASGPIFGESPSVDVMRGQRTLSLVGLEGDVASFVTALASN